MRSYHVYTDEEREFLFDAIPSMTYAEAADAFSKMFGIERTHGQIAEFASRNGLSSGYNSFSNNRVKWTSEMDEWMRLYVPGHSQDEVRAEFRRLFGYMPTTSQIKNRVHSLGIMHGTNGGRFGSDTQSYAPGWNRGLPQREWMPKESIERTKDTRFKLGSVPHNARPIGSEYVDSDGYVFVKVKDEPGAKRFGKDGNWKQRSHIVYEKKYGQIPDGCLVVHADGDKSNDSHENLLAVDKRDYAVVMRQHMDYYDRESLKVCMAIAKLKRVTFNAGKEEA